MSVVITSDSYKNDRVRTTLRMVFKDILLPQVTDFVLSCILCVIGHWLELGQSLHATFLTIFYTSNSGSSVRNVSY